MTRIRTLLVALTLVGLGPLADGASAREGDRPNTHAQGQAPRPAARRLEIELRGNVLRVRVRHAPLEAVLDEIGRRTGILIHANRPLAGTLTQEFEALPLEQGLRRLFRDADLALLYEGGTKEPGVDQGLIHLWLFPKADRAPAAGTSPWLSPMAGHRALRPPGSIGSAGDANPEREETAERGRATRLAALDLAAAHGDTATLRRAVLGPDRALQRPAVERLAQRDPQEAVKALLQGSTSDQSAQRLQALHLLHQTPQADDRTVTTALAGALADDDASVREYAVHALAERGGPDATEYLRWALRDPDPSIRRMVIESLGSVGRQDLRQRLLVEALADGDASVRVTAESWLEQAVSEAR